MTNSSPFALDITASPDLAFDLADALGMEGETVSYTHLTLPTTPYV